MSLLTVLFDLSGKTAIVTGASRGLGVAATHALAGAGANIVLIGREIETLRQQEKALEEYDVRTLALQCDMSIPEQVVHAAERARDEFEQIDILVNNAGIIRRSPAENYPIEDWNVVLNTNLTGLFLLTQEIGRGMIAQRSGKIINIASLLSFSGGLNVVAYTASKSGVAGLTRALANEWGRFGVNVNAIAPGYFKTEATEALQNDAERYNALLKRIPAGRWGEAHDLYGTFVYLASKASDYVHGHILTVDGGWMAA
jgi:2-deoxy-D-gluconate 3-dehydrogenase